MHPTAAYNTPTPLCNELDHVLLGYCPQCSPKRHLHIERRTEPVSTEVEGYAEWEAEMERLNAAWPPNLKVRGEETGR